MNLPDFILLEQNVSHVYQNCQRANELDELSWMKNQYIISKAVKKVFSIRLIMNSRRL